MPAAEPTLALAPPAAARYFLATRPAFLTVSLGACLVGIASAYADGVPIDAAKAWVTIVFALVAQAGANVLNDYYDALSGNDAANVDRVYPFTGGSRFIQNGLISEARMLAFGLALFCATAMAGLWLMTASAPGLFFFGAAGFAVGWAYSAPPLTLVSRGLGEACIWFAWMLIAAGADYVQRGAPSTAPWIASAGYALLVTNVLYINQFPDRKADEAVGKRHWVVRLGADRAAPLYAFIGIAANVCVVLAASVGILPAPALLALFAMPLTIRASMELLRFRSEPAKLAPAIKFTIGAALLHAALLSAGLMLAGWLER